MSFTRTPARVVHETILEFFWKFLLPFSGNSAKCISGFHQEILKSTSVKVSQIYHGNCSRSCRGIPIGFSQKFFQEPVKVPENPWKHPNDILQKSPELLEEFLRICWRNFREAYGRTLGHTWKNFFRTSQGNTPEVSRGCLKHFRRRHIWKISWEMFEQLLK